MGRRRRSKRLTRRIREHGEVVSLIAVIVAVAALFVFGLAFLVGAIESWSAG